MTREEREAHWRGLLARQQASGLSVRAWCEQEAVIYTSFAYWRRRLAKAPPEAPLTLLRVDGAEPALWVSAGTARIEVRPGFGADLSAGRGRAGFLMLAAILGAPAVYVAAEPVDFRKSIDGLALAVESSLGASPLSGSVFVFFNRGRDKVKLLWWDRHGFWLAYKRLEKGRFRLPAETRLSRADLLLVLEGVDLSARRFREVAASRAA